ncbi:hypothetical protein OG563_26370 [Nocardia vinacea]|uniref:Uncharacterized protein n=1 Tax=Nocardia vinacea TaxID=96468 RepID=A0ABZ1YLH2_9NOCA|nr:hypothetical protein [Nocardia vinacea]
MPDKLKNIKAFLVANAYDGFGARRYIGHTNLDSARAYIHEFAVPTLYAAIMVDDPYYEPVGIPTSTNSNAAVIAYVREIERDMVALKRIDPYGDLWLMMCKPGPEGCFMDELHAAMDADDPEWRVSL